jgi:hypothetical protein
MTWLGVWNDLRGDSLASDAARRFLRLNWSSDQLSTLKSGDKEWQSVIRIIKKYTPAQLPRDIEPISLQRAGPPLLILIYQRPEGGVIVGTIQELSDWVREDEAEFDFLSRNIIFGLLSATVGIFLIALRA